MQRLWWRWVLVAGLWVGLVAGQGISQRRVPPVTFDQPGENEAVQGRVGIRLKGRLETVEQITLAFAYAQNPGAWFVLAQRQGIPADGLIAVWDTTTLTDGDYFLRLSYTTHNGDSFTVQIHVRVRNYTPIETATPTSTPTLAPGESPSQRSTATPTPSPTPLPPTPLPPNPAAVDEATLLRAGIGGAALAALVLLLLGVYRAWRR